MITKLINPFRYIAGGYSLMIGIVILFFTALIGFLSNTHFPDIISVKTSSDFPFNYHIFQIFSNWIIVSFILYIISIIASNSKVRIIDIFGTQALARFPYLIVSFIGFSSSLNNLGKNLTRQFIQQGEPVELSVFTIVIAISLIFITLFLTVWLIVLMYNAFKISANLKGYKSILLFIAGLIISIFLSGLISNLLIQA
ncbi:MAG: hypothetical protein DRI95_05570 [Bacteroidetes bacterium]|nr:MAG: hypothetical protein DRI95_05570 [Bacteroidota bacterium]